MADLIDMSWGCENFTWIQRKQYLKNILSLFQFFNLFLKLLDFLFETSFLPFGNGEQVALCLNFLLSSSNQTLMEQTWNSDVHL